MRIAICDDDLLIHEELCGHLSDFFDSSNLPEIICCSSGEEIVSLFSANEFFDIVFMDVEMGTLNGLEAAGEIRRLAPETIIIFVSNHRNYVFDAFHCEALHYIVKPVTKAEFREVFIRAMHKYNLLNNSFTVKWKQTRISIKVSDIIYIEGYKRRTIIHTQNGTFDHIGKLSEAYDRLKAHGFLLVHQGYIVNMQYIHSFLSDEIILLDGSRVMVSVRKRSEALQSFDKYLQRLKW